jgi:hypothetical protein
VKRCLESALADATVLILSKAEIGRESDQAETDKIARPSLSLERIMR